MGFGAYQTSHDPKNVGLSLGRYFSKRFYAQTMYFENKNVFNHVINEKDDYCKLNVL